MVERGDGLLEAGDVRHGGELEERVGAQAAPSGMRTSGVGMRP